MQQQNKSQKLIVIEKWSELVNELSIYLEDVKSRGGTMGYKVGYFCKEQKRLKEIFENL